MAVPLRKILKNPKFDAVVSFKKSEGGKGGRSSSPGFPRKEKKTSSGSSDKTHKAKSSSVKGGRGSRGNKADDGVTSSVVAALVDKGSARKNSGQVSLVNGVAGNRADRLQVRLNALESEINRLKLHEEQLEHRLKRFIRQKVSLVSTMDDIHLKLEGLSRSHKSISAPKN